MNRDDTYADRSVFPEAPRRGPTLYNAEDPWPPSDRPAPVGRPGYRPGSVWSNERGGYVMPDDNGSASA